MWYNSKIVAHSISDLGNDIITWEITLPKWLVAEFNTHKIEIERNSASSRAVPTRVIIDMIKEFPVMPIDWRENAKGMSPQVVVDRDQYDAIWLEARDAMIGFVDRLMELKPTPDKQRVNRLLEPWMWTVIVCTMTGGGKIGINNFFGLRDTIFAQPEFREVAHMMHEQYHDSTPIQRTWHLPYVSDLSIAVAESMKNEAAQSEALQRLAIISSARCGRVTHYKQGEERSTEDEIERGISFATNGHFSPLRHAARAAISDWYGNMFGWKPISKIMMQYDYVTKCCERAT